MPRRGFLLGLFFCALAVPVEDPAKSDTPEARFAEKHRGVSWVAGREIGRAELARLRQHHVDWIVQTPFGWQRSLDSPSVGLVTKGRILWGERDIGLETTTRIARELGIRTLLKPHVWASGGQWRGDIAMRSEVDWRQWFDSYSRFMMHYARLAQRLGIEALCIGTELHQTVLERPGDWQRLIEQIRSVYSGKLTYAANWYKEFEDVPFWGELDYIGIQAYFPLTDQDKPSVDTLVQGWAEHLPKITAVQKRFNRPVLFTEIGYKSTPSSAIEPWVWPKRLTFGQKTDPATQANAYEAFFRTFWPEPWFAGAYIWKWYPRVGSDADPDNIDFTPQGKPALEVMTRWYHQSAPAPPRATAQ